MNPLPLDYVAHNLTQWLKDKSLRQDNGTCEQCGGELQNRACGDEIVKICRYCGIPNYEEV